MNDEITIQPGCGVTMHFSLTLEDGTVVEDTFQGEPISFTMGDGTLIRGMELAIYGLPVGAEQTIVIGPEEGWGEHDEAGLQQMPLSDFPADMRPEVGQIIGFETPTGEEVLGAVMEIDGDTVQLDFNHPLAGHDVTFRCKILDIQPG